MGNRCVITTKENFENNGVGVYMHWNGGRDSVEPILKYCEMKGYRPPSEDCYGWARLCQVIGNALGGTLSVGIDTINHLDCDNFDNGVYIIHGWRIIGRRYFDGAEQDAYPENEVLEWINESMPAKEQIDPVIFKSEMVARDELKVGDVVFKPDEVRGGFNKCKVVGIGTREWVNGHDVRGVPFVNLFGFTDDDMEDNPNNYLLDTEYRRLSSEESA